MQQIVSILTGIDIAVVEDVLHPSRGMPGKYRELTAYNLNKWIEKRDVSQTGPEDDGIPVVGRGDIEPRKMDPSNPSYQDGLDKLDHMADMRCSKANGQRGQTWMPSVKPYSAHWKRWFDWRNNHGLGTMFMVTQAEMGHSYTVPELEPPRG